MAALDAAVALGKMHGISRAVAQNLYLYVACRNDQFFAIQLRAPECFECLLAGFPPGTCDLGLC